MRLSKAGLAAMGAYIVVASPCIAKDRQPDLSGLSIPCQEAYKAMKACLRKTMASGAPASIQPQWNQQIADSVQMWRALRGQPEVEKSCKEIAAKPDCES